MKLNLSKIPPYPKAIEWKPFFLLISVFYFSFLLLTPLGTDISFLPASLEPRGVYHLLHIDGGDDAGHFAYLRSIFFDHDIDFLNEPYYVHHRTVLDTGYVTNQWKIGPAILWFPFFLLAHGITWIYNILGVPLTQDGYSFVYFSSTALGSATYVFLGLILNFWILRRWFSNQAAFISVVLFFLTTGLVYFAFIRSRMAHANDYFLICLFVYAWLEFRENPSSLKAVTTGLIGGLMLVTRINSAGYLLFPLYDLGRAVRMRIKARQNIDLLIWKFYALMFGCAFLVFSLQLNINRILTGSWSPIPQTGDQKVQLFSPENWSGILNHLFHLIFGSNWGLLWHAPVYLLGAAGFYFFVRTHRSLGIPFILALLAPLGLVIVWPHHGLSYSYRHLLTINFLLSFGVAHLINREPFRMKSLICGIGGFLLILWAYLQLCLFKIVVPHDSSSFVWQAFRSLKLFWELPQTWYRGENFFFVLSRPGFQLQTPLDWYLIVVYPILQISILLILLFTGIYIWDRMNKNLEFKSWTLKSINILAALFVVGLHLMIQIQNDKRSPEFISQRKTRAAGNFVLPLAEIPKTDFRLHPTP